MGDASVDLVARNALLAAALAMAVVTDVRTRRIPNAVTVPVALAGLGLFIGAQGWDGLREGLGGLVIGMGLGMPVWMAGGMGAGDLKLLGMVGALRGMQFAIWTGLYGAVAGGVIALIALACRPGGAEVLRNVGSYLCRVAVLRVGGPVEPTASSFRISYATAIALGALAAAVRLPT